MRLRYLETGRHLKGTGGNSVQANGFPAILTMEMSVIVVMLVFGTMIAAKGIFSSIARIHHLMHQALFFKSLQRTVECDPVCIGQQALQFRVSNRLIATFQQNPQYLYPHRRAT